MAIPWHDVATKDDLRLMRTDVEIVRAELRTDLQNVRVELRSDMAVLRPKSMCSAGSKKSKAATTMSSWKIRIALDGKLTLKSGMCVTNWKLLIMLQNSCRLYKLHVFSRSLKRLEARANSIVV